MKRENRKPVSGKAVKCPMLNTWDIPTCLSDKGIVVPSLSDLNEYCRTDNHVNCPVFQNQPIEKGTWLPFCYNTAEAIVTV